MIVQADDMLQMEEVLIEKVADIGLGALGLEQAVSLLPYPEGMRVNASQFGQICYTVYSHDNAMRTL